MSLNILLILFIFFCLSLWLLALYVIYLPMLTLLVQLKRSGFKASIHLVSHQIIINKEGKITLTITRSLKGYTLKMKLPYPCSISADLNDHCKDTSEYFIYSGKNLFLSAADQATLTYCYERRAQFQELFTTYSPILADHRLQKLCCTPFNMLMETRTKKLSLIAPDLTDILNFTKAINELVSFSDKNIVRTRRDRGFVAENKMLFSIILITAVIFSLIGLSASLLQQQRQATPPLKLDTFIQIWEIYKDFANVYDVNENDQGMTLIAKDYAALKDYAGFKPELVPWGFRVSPKYNYRHHYKILIFPKETELLGFINYSPMKQTICSDHLIVVYDLSEIKKKSYINIYMHYRGNIRPINIAKVIPRANDLIFQDTLSPSLNLCFSSPSDYIDPAADTPE